MMLFVARIHPNYVLWLTSPFNFLIASERRGTVLNTRATSFCSQESQNYKRACVAQADGQRRPKVLSPLRVQANFFCTKSSVNFISPPSITISIYLRFGLIMVSGTSKVGAQICRYSCSIDSFNNHFPTAFNTALGYTRRSCCGIAAAASASARSSGAGRAG